MDKVARFKSLTQAMAETYEAKNADYGDSFGNSVKKYSPIAGLVRMEDKFNRLENLIMNCKEAKVKTESLKDTLLDLANYAIMLHMEID